MQTLIQMQDVFKLLLNVIERSSNIQQSVYFSQKALYARLYLACKSFGVAEKRRKRYK